MKKEEISVVQIGKSQSSETAKHRATRFSRVIHKEDNTLKEGNSVAALEWAKKFFVK